MNDFLTLLTSKRVIVAVVTALAPMVAKLLGMELTEDQLIQVTSLAVALIAALTVRDSVPVEPVVVPPVVSTQPVINLVMSPDTKHVNVT